MKRNYIAWILFLLLLIAIAMMFLPKAVSAGDWLPNNIGVFQVEDHTCVLYEFNNGVGGIEAELECFCPCEGCKEVVYTEPEEKDKPTPPPPPPPPPPPEPTPEPKPEKEKCNSGRGNDSEGSPDCDPGNSGGKNQGGD